MPLRPIGRLPRCGAWKGSPQGTPELRVPRGQRFRRDGARIHESTDLERAGRRTREGIPTTDPARTLLDLARRTGDGKLLERDRPRQDAIVLPGWTVLRSTWKTFVEHPEDILRAVRSAISMATPEQVAT